MDHVQWQSSALSHQGNVRDHNEDSCLDNGERGLWVVADGMGGHDQGDYASQLIVERLQDVSLDGRPSEFVDNVENTLMEVNQHLYDKSMQGEQPSVIGSTVVAFGTSMPELTVNVNSAIGGDTGLAIGNILGSNVFNICAIVGIVALITPLAVSPSSATKDLPMCLRGCPKAR